MRFFVSDERQQADDKVSERRDQLRTKKAEHRSSQATADDVQQAGSDLNLAKQSLAIAKNRDRAALFLRLSMPSVLASFEEAGYYNPDLIEITFATLTRFLPPRNSERESIFSAMLDEYNFTPTSLLKAYYLLEPNAQKEFVDYLLIPAKGVANDRISIGKLCDALNAVVYPLGSITAEFLSALTNTMIEAILLNRGDNPQSIRLEMYLFHTVGYVPVVPMLMGDYDLLVNNLVYIEQRADPKYKEPMHAFLKGLAIGRPILADRSLVSYSSNQCDIADTTFDTLYIDGWRSVVAYYLGQDFTDVEVALVVAADDLPKAPSSDQFMLKHLMPFSASPEVNAARESQASRLLSADATIATRLREILGIEHNPELDSK